MELRKNTVYLVESPTDTTVLLAIGAVYNKETGYVEWWDTVRGRMKKVECILCNTEDEFKFTNGENIYTFTKLTLDKFKEKVRDKVVFGKDLEFSSDEELQKFYLNNF